jgi:hypothetical protein
MAPNIPAKAASNTKLKTNMQMATIKDAAPMPKQTTPRATFSATLIDVPSTGNIPPIFVHVAEGHHGIRLEGFDASCRASADRSRGGSPSQR